MLHPKYDHPTLLRFERVMNKISVNLDSAGRLVQMAEKSIDPMNKILLNKRADKLQKEASALHSRIEDFFKLVE